VRERLINSISKEGQRDGFDGILMRFNKKNNSVSYAGANNGPLLVRNNEYIELPKDKMPVGKGEKKESFTLHNIDLQKGDGLYLFTDGYADQFGGPNSKKFMYKPLHELLLSVNNLNPEEQKNILDQKFIDWKGHLEQVDDVLLIGIKI
jgi:serine phosphatase RsbU (regulator of sigma subunit)